MKKLTLSIALIFYSASGLVLSAAQPAPAEKGLAENTDSGKENTEKTTAKKEGGEDTTLKEQIASLQSEIQALRTTLDNFADTQKELQALKGRVVILEGDYTGLMERAKKLETEKEDLATRVKTLEGDNATLLERMREFADTMGNMKTDGQKQLTAKPVWVKAAVRFFNHEGRSLKMNVNGVWHTLKDGENTIWVNYGPVHVYRYTGAEPRTFAHWKPHMDGYLMEFDVGTR